MTDDIQLSVDPDETVETPPPPVKADERYVVNPMERRFLFVDVAAQRAKQLRKGALNRLALAAAAGDTTVPVHSVGQKPERVAMEELRRGFVQYQLPDGTPLAKGQEG